MWIRGDDLNKEQRDRVLRAFGYRWTHDNMNRIPWYIYTFGPCPTCDIAKPAVAHSAAGHNHPTIPLITDAQWLNEHQFQFDPKGKELVGNAGAVWLPTEQRKPFPIPTNVW